jgi:pterin-4a-carbinolamine dehydratase
VRIMKVSPLMREYFDPRQPVLCEAPGRDLPIKPKKETWTRNEHPESIRRQFNFQTTKSLIDFLEDVIQMQEEMGHYGKLLVEKNVVLAQVSTVSLQRVTELDIEWAAQVDDIYNDAVMLDG